MGFAPSSCKATEEEMERLMAAYGQAVKRMCRLYLKDAALAEDAAQETFLKAWRHWGDFRGECGEQTWLMRIAINTCRDMLRRGWLRWMDRRVTPEATPLAMAEEPRPALAEAVQALPRLSREVVVLYYYQGMDVKETAQTLGINVNTAKSRLLRARKLLKIHLEGGGNLDE